jgi:hypothetical protein
MIYTRSNSKKAKCFYSAGLFQATNCETGCEKRQREKIFLYLRYKNPFHVN